MDSDSDSDDERPTSLWEAMPGFTSNMDVIFYMSYSAGLLHRVLRKDADLDHDDPNVEEAVLFCKSESISNSAYRMLCGPLNKSRRY
jgi:hypothetical protein